MFSSDDRNNGFTAYTTIRTVSVYNVPYATSKGYTVSNKQNHKLLFRDV